MPSRMNISEVSIPAVWKTTEVGFYENLYFMLYNDSDLLLRSSQVYLGNKIYFAEQLSFDMVQGMNDKVRDLRVMIFLFMLIHQQPEQ